MVEKNKTYNHIIIGMIVIILIFIFQEIASKGGGLSAGLFNYSLLDKDNIFLWISVHHLIQMLIALLLIFIVHKKIGLAFYLKPKKDRMGIKYTIIFSIVIIGYVVISYILGYVTNSIEPYAYEINIKNILGTLGFQFLLSGTSEEVLFRALPITILGYVFHKNKKMKHRLEIIIAAFLFSIAHISWGITPFTISFSWFQLIYAFALGIVYGITYVKSKSIIYPMIMHSSSNVFMVGVGYIFAVTIG